MQKKVFVLVLTMLLCACTAFAEGYTREWSADFDGDGAEEQFILTGEEKMLYTAGDLTYVDGEQRIPVLEKAGFLPEECAVWAMEDGILFKAEESYGIGGTVSYVYRIQDGKPVRTNGMFSHLEWLGEGQEFVYLYLDTDLKTDRSGQTLKPYYVYWKDGFFFEYGGSYISEEQLAAWPEGYNALEYIYGSNNRVTTIFYRANGIVNVSYSDNITNGNITLLLQDGELMMLDTERRPTDMPEETNYGGKYLMVTGVSRFATFPEEDFPQPADE